jgi:hypothetical protein
MKNATSLRSMLSDVEKHNATKESMSLSPSPSASLGNRNAFTAAKATFG